MPWSGIYGHDNQRDALWRAYQNNRLGHSYLFVGPEGIGKRLVARQLAKTISCETVARQLQLKSAEPGGTVPEPCGACPTCQQIEAGTYQDLHEVGLPEEKQEFPIGLMKDLLASLAVKPQRENARRIAIIDDADTFNEESANCFLKTLEEPAPQSLLILIGTAAERQLPTIRSRCQVISFQPLPLKDFTAAAVQAEIVPDPQAAEALFSLAQGSLSRLSLVKEEDLSKIMADIAKALAAPKFASVAFGTMLVKFCEAVKEGAVKRQRARFAVECIAQLLQAALLHAEQGSSPFQSHPEAIRRLASLTNIEAIPELLEATLEAEYHIDRHFQLALLLEAYADRLGRILAS
ncbi:MAG TPA: AAA family ATPase [Gemmatales bacterium]|nr:AAA family ATPase [Gemmatales bacterium]